MNVKSFLKDRFFVLLVLIIVATSLGIVRTMNSKVESYSGKISYLSCKQTRKSETKFNFSIQLEDSKTFTNTLETSCNVIDSLSVGEQVSIDVYGSWLQQINYNGQRIFSFNKTERARKDIFAFMVIALLLSIGGLIFKVYSRVKNLKKIELC
ncbi:hypothetical protein FE810_13840 [Thalassotalea litorea]|uniref:DUF3592 domain-containing protein n=1 Tax=Thalassotalea litorea TaxID=2020715 RepID=A0A5R9IDC6_9GAMM|nr:hypothetical protein [Thalassotalea litorea]TLU61595.1 hypothetical protein FE810_13840 [Thalassotalea litorea]